MHEWLKKNERFVSICGAILAVVHPEQYETGLKILNCIAEEPMRLREPQHVERMLDAWCSPFSGCAIIANRASPCHRDVGSRHEWYDVICTMGSYGTTTARLPGLAAAFDYRPGTAIALCG
jgi:Oxygenase domain of the 2OGFeDO superfamily